MSGSGGGGLAFEEVRVSYGDRGVLKGLSGRIVPGRFVALIGPNGSGKSTLLKALGGLVPYEGSIRLEGREVRSYPRSELGRSVGVLPQQVRLDTALTVYDLIGLGRLPHEALFSRRSPEDERRVLEAADAVQLGDLLFRSAARISGGEAQRALIAMVLAQDPRAFLLDEPSSATDIRHSVAIFSLFRRLATEAGRVVAAAVHDVNLAVRFADEVVALKDGAILYAGPIANLEGALLEALYDTRFERFVSRDGIAVWHAVGAA